MTTLLLPRQAEDTRAGHSLLRGLEAVWPLAFPTGGVVDLRDLKGGNVLTDNNTVTTAAGPSSKLARATQFTAANLEYLSVADNASLSFGAGVACTITCWFYPDTAAFMGLVGKWEGNPNTEFDIHFNGTNLRCDISNDGIVAAVNLISTDAVSVGAWNRMAFMFDPVAQLIGLQLNDLPIQTISYTGSIFNGASALYIGRSVQGGGFMNGRIADVDLWKRVLSRTEGSYLYNGGQGRGFRRNRGFF